MERLDKTWGWESWFANSPLYCGKIIYVRFNRWSSEGKYHYHKLKDETFFVVSGTLRLEYYEGDIARSAQLSWGDSFHVAPGVKHRFSTPTPEGCKFIEASTQHFEEDSYRVELVEGDWV